MGTKKHNMPFVICTSLIIHLACPQNFAEASSSISLGTTGNKNSYAKFWAPNKVNYGSSANGEWPFLGRCFGKVGHIHNR